MERQARPFAKPRSEALHFSAFRLGEDPLRRGLYPSLLGIACAQLACTGAADDPAPAPRELRQHVPALPFWQSGGSMANPRAYHCATLLPSGKVLVTGGQSTAANAAALASAELYDPTTNAWSAAAPMNTARVFHTAALLPNGKVLVAGGANANGALASAELYDTTTNAWTAAASMATPRYCHTAALFANGDVGVQAGTSDGKTALPSAEVYNAVNDAWTSTMSMATARYSQTATLLPNRQLLVAGGGQTTGPVLTAAELYDPTTKAWSAAAPMATGRESHTATLLATGQVLVAGGQTATTGSLSSAELYDPTTNTWSAAASLATSRDSGRSIWARLCSGSSGRCGWRGRGEGARASARAAPLAHRGCRADPTTGPGGERKRPRSDERRARHGRCLVRRA